MKGEEELTENSKFLHILEEGFEGTKFKSQQELAKATFFKVKLFCFLRNRICQYYSG